MNEIPEDVRVPSSVRSGRLAITTPDPIPTISELGLDPAQAMAVEFQKLRSMAEWNELAAVMRDGETSEWVREIHGLIGVVGELVLVAVEAEVEKDIGRRELARVDSSGDRSEMARRATAARSLRFFAEGQGNYLTVAGHGLTNIVLRTLALHLSFDVRDVATGLHIEVDAFRPQSRQRGAWASMTPDVAAGLKEAAASLNSPELTELAGVLVGLAKEPRWVALHSLRNEQYHRWRGESPGVTGVGLDGDSMAARLRRGEAVGFGATLLPEYEEGHAVLKKLDMASRSGLDALVEIMSPFMDGWQSSFRSLVGTDRT